MRRLSAPTSRPSRRQCEHLEPRQLLSALPSGFEENFITRVVTPTASCMEFAPDGRLFVADSFAGKIRIIKNNALLPDAFLTLATDHNGERGINGIAFDPNYSTTSPYLYVYYTTAGASPVNRLSRFKVSATNSDLADTKEEILLDNIPSPSGFHNGGFLHFGADKMLYLGIGDGKNSANSQSLATPLGKILRLNATNPAALIPADNPFFNTAGARKEIWALGFRNPFSGNIKPGTNTVYVNDVGESSWEEIDDVQKGGNYGWPTVEGFGNNASFINPIYAYDHGPTHASRAITGGVFYTGSAFPAQFQNDYFFADFTQGFINSLDTSTKTASSFATGSQEYLDLDTDSSGNLWTLDRIGNVTRIRFTGTNNRAPIPIIKANPTTGNAPLTVNFAGNESYDPDNPAEPLVFKWDFGDGQTGAGMYIAHTYNANGKFPVTLTVTDTHNSSTTSSQFFITVGTNKAPTPTINLPANNSLYTAGQTINFSGSGTDPEDGTLPASAFTWSFVFHHQTHTHPFLADRTGITSGSFAIPTVSETDPDQFYRITLTVKDSGGMTSSTFVDIKPSTANFTINSNIPGASLTLDGQPFTSPMTVTGVVNQTRALGAPLTQNINGTNYQFVSWSDGGAANHNISIPSTTTTYTANYQVATTGAPETLRAIGDAYARDGGFASTNFGQSPELQVKQSTPGFTREAFLRFAMTSIANIGSARLRVFGRLTGTESTNIPLGLFTVSDTSWNENALTFNSRPGTSAGALTQTTILDSADRWYEFDVTSYLKQQKSFAAGGVAFALKALASSVPYMSFASDEAGANQPQLIVTPAATASATFTPTDDTYGRDGDFANTNFGSAPELQVKQSTPGYTRETYLRFDIAGAPTVTSAKLRLFGSLDNPGSINIAARGSYPFWSESTVTFNSAPPPLTGDLVSTTINSTTGQWYEWDVTAYVKQRQQMAIDTLIGLTLHATNSTTQFARFNSSEALTNQPQLVIT